MRGPRLTDFKELSDHVLEFRSDNNLKLAGLQGMIIASCIVLFKICLGFIRDGVLFQGLRHSEGGEWLFILSLHLLPLPFLLLWIFAPRTRILLHRDTGHVLFQRGKSEYRFPWGQVSFNQQALPSTTGSGGGILFTLFAPPPFPPGIQDGRGRKFQPAPDADPVFKLGSIDVKTWEQGRGVYDFLDAWMNSRQPAGPLFASFVQSPS